MIFLEIQNRALEELLLWKFESGKQCSKFEKTDQLIADFDGVVFRVHTLPDDRTKLLVSVSLASPGPTEQQYVEEYLKREYGPYLCPQPEAGASVSLLYDLNTLPDDYAPLAEQASMLRRHHFAGCLSRFLEFHALGEEASGSQRAVIHYRPNESIVVQAQGDRITVIFSTIFRDADDVIISKLFLQELVEVRRRIDRAPQILFSHTPPAELLGTDAVMGENVAYITFVLFPRHLTSTTAPRTINLIHSFRNYLHYHIKCSKSYIYQRMRAKTIEFLKILNRARLTQCFSMPVIQLDGPLISRYSQTTGFPSASLMIDGPVNHGSDPDEADNGFSPIMTNGIDGSESHRL